MRLEIVITANNTASPTDVEDATAKRLEEIAEQIRNGGTIDVCPDLTLKDSKGEMIGSFYASYSTGC